MIRGTRLDEGPQGPSRISMPSFRQGRCSAAVASEFEEAGFDTHERLVRNVAAVSAALHSAAPRVAGRRSRSAGDALPRHPRRCRAWQSASHRLTPCEIGRLVAELVVATDHCLVQITSEIECRFAQMTISASSIWGSASRWAIRAIARKSSVVCAMNLMSAHALFRVKHEDAERLAGDYRPLAGDFPNNYYMPLGWPRPSWGKWQLRDVDVISVQRIPAEQASYCYGKRIVYEDSQSHYALWEDAYDSSMKLWKIALVAQRQVRSTSLGYIFGPVTSSVWDVQADHMTNVTTQNKLGDDMLTDDDVPAQYRDLVAYSTPAGLYGILK
jgi:uncharacterized protein DUF1329